MGSPFVFAHISDLHVSEFGDTFHDRLRVVKRSTNVANVDEKKLEIVWEESGWRVVHARGKRPGKIGLLDPAGYAHAIPSVKDGGGVLDPVERAAAKACRLEARRAPVLAANLPTAGALKVLFEATPRSSNLRFLRAVDAIEQAKPDAIVITGDITDDGVGYELVESAFRRYIDAGRLFAIPGNHDLYLFPLRGSVRPRATHASKRAAWEAFAARIGLELDPCGAWIRGVRGVGGGGVGGVGASGVMSDVMMVGVDSCARPQRRFFRHNGAIGPAQLEFLRALGERDDWKRAKHRLVLLHHHVVPLPHGVGKRAPSEIGMRLDDGLRAAEVFDQIGVTAVLHGHRHVSEQRQPAGSNFTILASPSLTLGCRSGDDPSFWRVELGDRMHAERVRVPMDPIEQDEDPSESTAFGLVESVTESATDLLAGESEGEIPVAAGDDDE